MAQVWYHFYLNTYSYLFQVKNNVWLLFKYFLILLPLCYEVKNKVFSSSSNNTPKHDHFIGETENYVSALIASNQVFKLFEWKAENMCHHTWNLARFTITLSEVRASVRIPPCSIQIPFFHLSTIWKLDECNDEAE